MKSSFSIQRSWPILQCVFLIWSATGLFSNARADDQKGDGYVAAVDLLPQSTAGVIRIPELPTFCDAWQQTQFGELLSAPEMQPFLDAQRERARNYFDTLDQKIGVQPEDLYRIASGEVVVAWLSEESDKRRPYSICVIADIRGMKQDADDAARKIDEDLKAGGATRQDVTHGEETIRVYTTKPKPGQLKLEEIALTWNDNRLIASDRAAAIKTLLDVASGESAPKAFSDRESYKKVMSDGEQMIAAANEPEATVCWEWYAEPFAMARILREVFEYDRRDDLNILELLKRQGFEVIEALGGIGVVNGKRFDVLHRGTVLAPGKLTKAAKMLRAKNTKREEIPAWPTTDTGVFYRFNWEIEEAFWAAESLVNDALGEDLFRPMIEGIRDDPEGPQIDLAKDFLPNLDDQFILVTDNTQPVTPESDRMLIAIRVKNADVVSDVIRKAMDVEPDASKLEIADLDVWRIEPGESDSDDIDLELAALGFEDDFGEEEEAPVLSLVRAIGVVRGAGEDDPAYLLFSSHSELLVLLGRRIRSGENGRSMVDADATRRIVDAIDSLVDGGEVAFDGVFHPAISLRSRYELFRRGELKDSDSLIANLMRFLLQDEDNEAEEQVTHAAKLPPFAKIETYFKGGGAFWSKTESGWSMTGFLMAE